MNKNYPVPSRMEHLPRDKRGYPIPYNVWRDTDGNPHFTINDSEKVLKIIAELRCPICGSDLEDNSMWFVGGPMSALHEGGCYIDQPMHEECAKYALSVCPYLAAPIFSKEIGTKKVDPEKMGKTTMFVDDTVINDRPVFFVAVHTTGYTMSRRTPTLAYLKPIRPYIGIEYWLQGEQISKSQAVELLKMNMENGEYD